MEISVAATPVADLRERESDKDLFFETMSCFYENIEVERNHRATFKMKLVKLAEPCMCSEHAY